MKFENNLEKANRLSEIVIGKAIDVHPRRKYKLFFSPCSLPISMGIGVPFVV